MCRRPGKILKVKYMYTTAELCCLLFERNLILAFLCNIGIILFLFLYILFYRTWRNGPRPWTSRRTLWRAWNLWRPWQYRNVRRLGSLLQPTLALLYWRRASVALISFDYCKHGFFFYSPGLKVRLGHLVIGSSVCPSVCLSICLSVRNSVPLTNKVQYFKFGWWYSDQSWTVGSSLGSSHLTDIICPRGWGGVKM